MGKPVSFSAEARKAFLGFATSRDALWPANFRDLNGSIARMAILADGNRIGTEDVGKEVARLQAEWKADPEGEFPKRGRWAPRQDGEAAHEIADLIGEQASTALDLFDRVQLEEVISTCRSSSSLADAGRRLFSESRKQRRQVNDSDR